MRQQKQIALSLFLFISLLISTNLSAQSISNLRLNHFSSSHKLPGVSVQCIFQDQSGILWLGIESLGLTRYDGKSYITYKNNATDSTSISNNFPTKIIEDQQGNIWTTTLYGLNKFNKTTETFTRYMYASQNPFSLSDNSLHDIYCDKNGYIWIATSNGISILNPERNEFLRLLFNPSNQKPTENIEVSSLIFDNADDIWIGTNRFGLFMIPKDEYLPLLNEWKNKPITQTTHVIKNIKSWSNNNTQDSSPIINSIRCIESQGSDTLWIGTQSGLFLFNKKTNLFSQKEFFHPDMLPLNRATYLSLFVDSDNTLWAGTSNNGLIVLENNHKNIHYLNADLKGSHNLKSNAVRDIIETKSGRIWIATKFEGLHSYDKRQRNFKLINEETSLIPGLPHDFTLCTLEDSHNNIWIGTKGGGLTKWDRKNNIFTHFKHNHSNQLSIASNRIEQIIEDIDGNLWIANENGLDCMNLKKQTFSHFLNIHVRNLCYTNDHLLWLGTTNGIFIFNPNTKQLVKLPTKHTEVINSENNLDITKIYQDRSGIIWFGTAINGLYEYNPVNDQLIIHTHTPNDPHTISGNMIRGIYQDSQGDIWIGTKSDGFNRFNKTTRQFSRYVNPNPQSSNTVYNFLEDAKGNLWMGTHKGIEKYTPSSNTYETYYNNYGLQGLIFESKAFGYTHDGLMMLGGSKGLNIFNPLTVKYKTIHSQMIITKITTDSKTIDHDVQTNKLYTIPYNTNTISFRFALLDYTNPDENRYSYQLENFDNDWINAENRNFASYTNLSPGTYVFKVKGANSEGEWSNKEACVTITIPTPFWMTWWFISICITTIISLFFMLHRIRLKILHQREIYLKEQVKQRTFDLSKAYEKLENVNREIEVRNNELLYQSRKIRSQNIELEQHHQNLEIQVNERTKDLEIAKQKAEESDQLKSAFLANMSHEIRTPLNAIIGFSDIITADDITSDERIYMNSIIQNNSNSLLQLINDIIDFSKIEANQLPISYNEFSVGEFMTELSNNLKSNKSLQEKGLNAALEIKDNLADRIINSAQERILQIFNNLTSNAIKHTNNGTITLGCQLGSIPNTIQFYVKDTGCGILKQNQEAIFERFRKIEDTSTHFQRGTGLGLSICRHLCQLLGGKIWLESEPNQGAAFYFTIPENPIESSVKQTQTNSQKITYPDWSGKTILIAEDEESNYEVLRYNLIRTHINIIRAIDGADAIKQINEMQDLLPDLILMDIKMPVMDGIEATKLIKRINPNIPIIIQTGYTIQPNFNEHDDFLYDSIITKPISTRKLLEKMAQYLNK